MSKVISFFNQERLQPLLNLDLKDLQSITVMQNKTIAFYFAHKGEVLIKATDSIDADSEVAILFSPKPRERCLSTTIDHEGLVNTSPILPVNQTILHSNESEKESVEESVEEFVSSYSTPDRKTKPQLLNVSPKRILKRAKLDDDDDYEIFIKHEN